MMASGRRIERLSAQQAHEALPDFVALLQDVVDAGASVGFLPPLSAAEAAAYWTDVFAAVEAGVQWLFVVRQQGRIAGTVQLALATKPNARHRGEVQKLLVLNSARRQGIARDLMLTLEEAALAAGRILLVLDTRQGDPAERLYASLGYTFAGAIPAYAANGDGGLDATALYYKLLR